MTGGERHRDERDHHSEHEHDGLSVASEYFRALGPGLTTGAADDDPSGIGTYSQQGAQFGFQLLWLALFSFPFMAVIQEMCGRIGIVTGHGLAANIRRRYSLRILFFVCLLLFCANTLNIAADLGAMAASVRLVFPQIGTIFLIIAFAFISLMLQIFIPYARYARILQFFALSLLAYVLTAFSVSVDWKSALYHTLVPTLELSKDQVFLICAILGTTISPYLFFWQTSQEVEAHRDAAGELHITESHHGGQHDEDELREDIHRMRVAVWIGMFFSNLIMFFIVVSCASTLYAHGITNIATADQAALAIKPFGGSFTYLLFCFGIIGTGLLAVPVLAGSSAYAIAESLGWKQGLYLKLRQARAFYGVITASVFLAIIADVAGLDPIRGLIYSGVANGLAAPVIMFFVIRISSTLSSFRNHPIATYFGWFIMILMCISGLAAIASLVL